MPIHSTKYWATFNADLSYLPRGVFTHGMSRHFDFRSTSGERMEFCPWLRGSIGPCLGPCFSVLTARPRRLGKKDKSSALLWCTTGSCLSDLESCTNRILAWEDEICPTWH